MMSPKRSLSADGDSTPDAKRPRIDSGSATPVDGLNNEDVSHVELHIQEEDAAVASLLPTQHSAARRGIQRSIALAMQHDGFNACTPEALESFSDVVETYLESIIQETKRFAVASRREHPTPVDFDAMLRRFNLPISSLKPHLRNPLPQSVVTPSFANATADHEAFAVLPLLGEELSGQADRDAKLYIPSSFPDFPSRHTYSFTPQEDISHRDPQKTREEAAKAAQQGEDALRRLVRASKMRKQKEVKSLVERDAQGRERFRLWESTMKRFMSADSRADQGGQVEVADHSMIVNGDAAHNRKEFPRSTKWSSGGRT